jgi:hypothetical protein
MISNEEAERLAKQKERRAKEDLLTPEEQVSSWTHIIETLEKINKNLGKSKPKPAWLCEGNYTDEYKAACKEEVMMILNMCNKKDLLTNSPSIVNAIYVNRLDNYDGAIAQKQKSQARASGQEETGSIKEAPAAEQNVLENDKYRAKIRQAYSKRKRI